MKISAFAVLAAFMTVPSLVCNADTPAANPGRVEEPRNPPPATGPKYDMDLATVSHNVATGELSDDVEETVGGFVPVNNDDDDYDGQIDSSQTTQVVGEDDLLPLMVRKIDPVATGGRFKLDIPGNVKIWENADHTGPILAGDELDATQDHTLYVEGIAPGEGFIGLTWFTGQTTIPNVDKVKVTVFSWAGVQNVPGYSKHRYLATGALETSKWLTPVQGEIKQPEPVNGVQPPDTPSDVQILWTEGPSIGKAVYQVNANYIWDLEVNVVQVKVEAPDAPLTEFVTPGFAISDTTKAGSVIIQAGDPAHRETTSIIWRNKVSLIGPTANGKIGRGATHLRVGYIQTIKMVDHSATYDVLDPATNKNKKLTSTYKGDTYPDRNVNADQGGDPVFYSIGNKQNNFRFTLDPVRDEEETKTDVGYTKTLIGSDDPRFDFSLYLLQRTVKQPVGDADLIHMDGNFLFTLAVAVKTIDTVNSDDQIYTTRAQAHWTFNVDKDYTAGFTLGGEKMVTHDDSFTAVTDGQQLFPHGGTPYNQLAEEVMQ
jgi:hypothetical protein